MKQFHFDRWEKGVGIGQRREKTAQRILECEYRGALSRHVECQGCRQRVLLAVYRCELHGECTIGREVEDAACCRNCDDFRPETSTEPTSNL